MDDLSGEFEIKQILENLLRAQLTNRAYLLTIIGFMKWMDENRPDFSQYAKGAIFEAFEQSLDSALQFAADHDPLITEALRRLVKKELGGLSGFHFPES